MISRRRKYPRTWPAPLKKTRKKRDVLARGAQRNRPGKGPPHKFKKGNKPGPGRPKGATNVMTRVLKEAILMAGEDVGNAHDQQAGFSQ
jgi:hypothetical protein